MPQKQKTISARPRKLPPSRAAREILRARGRCHAVARLHVGSDLAGRRGAGRRPPGPPVFAARRTLLAALKHTGVAAEWMTDPPAVLALWRWDAPPAGVAILALRPPPTAALDLAGISDLGATFPPPATDLPASCASRA